MRHAPTLALLSAVLPACLFPENVADLDRADSSLSFGARAPANDVRVATLDRHGIPYDVWRRPIQGDPSNKSVLEIELPELDQARFDTVRGAFGNLSDVKFQPGRIYRLEDFLWPIAQAATNENIPFASVDIEGMPANLSLQTNCWSTVYEIFRDDPDELLVFQNSVDTVLEWFNDATWWHRPSEWSDSRQFSSPQALEAALRSLSPDDVVVAYDCFDPEGRFCEAVHAATVVDDGLLFERTGGATATDVYRFVGMKDFQELWYYPDRHFFARRRAGTEPLPDPRWVLDFSQMTEGWYTFFTTRRVAYQVDPFTGLRSLPAADLHRPLEAPPVVFRDLTTGPFDALVDQTREILDIAAEGLVSGCGNERFCPEQAFTRAQMVHLVGGVLEAASAGEIPMPVRATEAYYDDVSLNDWFAPRVQWARHAGIITSAQTSFRPHDPVTRAEMITMFAGAIDYFLAEVPHAADPTDSRLALAYPDTAGHWAEANIDRLSQVCRIASPLPGADDRFEPNARTTRADAARAVERMFRCLDEASRRE
jgi:hypothetical protein